jgi:hypothetical protein
MSSLTRRGPDACEDFQRITPCPFNHIAAKDVIENVRGLSLQDVTVNGEPRRV